MGTFGLSPETGLIGIFGGTFDPIHNGHLRSAQSLLEELNFQVIYFLPSGTPPHRSPTLSSADDRLEMVKLAVSGNSKLAADDRESCQQGKTYTIDTLKSFRSEYPHESLVFIAGMDAYLDIPNWKQWQNYLDYVHIVVMRRPGYEQANESWGDRFLARSTDELVNVKCGHVYFAQSRMTDISSTRIRQKIQANQSIRGLLPEAVMNYINRQQLYA